jgi:hypothetical protein
MIDELMTKIKERTASRLTSLERGFNEILRLPPENGERRVLERLMAIKDPQTLFDIFYDSAEDNPRDKYIIHDQLESWEWILSFTGNCWGDDSSATFRQSERTYDVPKMVDHKIVYDDKGALVLESRRRDDIYLCWGDDSLPRATADDVCQFVDWAEEERCLLDELEPGWANFMKHSARVKPIIEARAKWWAEFQRRSH